MPYALQRRNNEYCVIREDTGTTAPGGCHDDKAEALRHLRALTMATEGHKLAEPLTRQEMVVARYALSGLCNKEIAKALVIQESTVRTHLQSVRRKLRVENRSGIVIKMLLLELVRLHELPELVVLAETIRKR